MHRALGYLSKRFVQIRPGEGRRVVLTFLYFFLIITSYYLIKPVSRSLVLGELGSRFVPYIDLICALVMGPVVTVFARLVDRVPKPALVSGSFLAVIGVLVVFWRLIEIEQAWISGAFYVWVSIFSVLVVTLFWLVANDLYRPREAKRLFGFIGSGGILGGIVGSSLAAVGAQMFGTQHLLLVASGVLVVCWIVVQQLWGLAPERALSEERQPAAAAAPQPLLANVGAFTRMILDSRYLKLLVLMVGLNKLVSTLIYYQLNPFIETAFPDQDARTAFTGMFFGGMNVIAFIVQFFFTSWILRRWGLFAALMTLPAGLLVGGTGLVILPVLWVAAVTELYDGALNYSLQQTTKELLYLPIDRSIRYKVKPFIDMVIFRFGKGIAAVAGIVLLDMLHLPARALGAIVLPLIVAWLATAAQLRRDYVIRIRTMLQARAHSRRQAAAAVAATESDLFGPLVDGHPTGRKMELIRSALAATVQPPAPAEELLAALKAYESLPEAPAMEGESEMTRLKRVISSQQEPVARRCQAMRSLSKTSGQETVDYLFGVITVEEDALLRQEALRGLVRVRIRGERLEFPVAAIKRQIAREVDDHRRVTTVARIYRRHHRGPLPANDALMGLLEVLAEESTEQVFRLLMLLYRPEDIHLVYEQMRSDDPYLRADAIELLDNLVDAGMRRVIAPVMDEDRFLGGLDAEHAAVHEPAAAYRMLQGAIWDHNCWLSATTLCAVGRLRLTTMRQELEKASRHTAPVIAKAAKVALHLVALPMT